MPEITIIERETLVVGVDTAFPPFSDLDLDGNPSGIEIDLLAALMETIGSDYELVSTGWDSLFLELVSGRFDAVLGGITAADAPDYVELSDPLFKMGEVAVVLEGDLQVESLEEIANLVVGVQPLSWGEFAITGQTAVIQVPSGNIRRYKTEKELIDALFNGYVDVIITHNTVFQSYDLINPGYLHQVPREGQEGWIEEYRFHMGVPQGADTLLQTLNDGIEQLNENGRIDEIYANWGYAPEFSERPKFVQDATAESIIAGIEKIGNYSLRFVLNRPDPFFDYKLAVPAMAMISPDSLEQLEKENQKEPVEERNEGDGVTFWVPAGTGPYKFKGWEPGEAITLTANSNYWGKGPEIETIVIKPIDDPHLRYELLRGNSAQLIENLSADDLEELDDNPVDQIEVYPRDPINIAYLGMNRDSYPFDNRNVRLAVASCINQTEIVEDYYPEESLIAQQFLPPNTFGFTPGLLWHDLDIGRAVQLLTEEGLENGVTLTLTIPSASTDYLPDPLRIAEQVKEQLLACNITITIQTLNDGIFTEKLVAGELPFHLSGWSADFPGPIGFLNTHFTGRGNGRQFGTPYPEIVELLDNAAAQSDNDVRRELYNQVNELLKDKAIFVPIAHGSSTLAARDYVPGVEPSPVRRETLSTMGPVTSTNPYFNYLVASEPLTLDPALSMDDATFVVSNQIFETLVNFKPATMILTGSLALEWSVNETFDVWEFTLRRDITFHDGSRFDTDAVIENLNRQWQTKQVDYANHAKKYRYFYALFSGFDIY
ncbi:MAG: transporter substrate-binding domain-containing protein [Anaerolineales bacterium]|nr:transporter substrate-binding domain-containing protein [Anaerolineales bacterium]